MPSSETWLNMSELAAIAGISEQAARKRARTADVTGPMYRQVIGRGGRSGARHEVALSSLSEELQEQFWDAAGGGCRNVPATLEAAPRPIASASQFKRQQQLLDAIGPALLCSPGSFERAEAIRRAVRPGTYGMSERALRRFLSTYEAGDYDLSLLGRRRPADAGKRRVQVSRTFDHAYLAAGHDPEQLAHWGARRDQLLIDWWASPSQRAGWKRVRLEVQTSLRRELADAGLPMSKSAVTVSQRAVMAAQHFREVDEYAHNRKVWDDGKTRIRRDNSQWRPLEQVVLDVKHLDVVLTRPDGSQVHPKMIGFLDSGTMRMFVHFVFPTKDERGVRQEHIIEAFIALVEHPEWGLPQRIYMDNGSENFRLEDVQPLLEMIRSGNLKTVVKAKPYSGASKPIESRFAELDRQVFSQMPGYVGGDRMKARRPELGKKTRPYPHGYDEFEREVRLRLADFEDMPIATGPFAGRSPFDIFLAAGHQPVTVDTLSLDAHFARVIERTVDRGAVSIEGTRYRRPDLPNGRKVAVALSYRRGALPLVRVPGADWAYLEPEQLYAPGLADGAIASAIAQSHDRKRVRDKRQLARPADVFGNVAARAADRASALPDRSQRDLRLLRVIPSEQAEEMGAAWQEGARAQLAAPSEAELRQRRIDAETRRLERKYGAF